MLVWKKGLKKILAKIMLRSWIINKNDVLLRQLLMFRVCFSWDIHSTSFTLLTLSVIVRSVLVGQSFGQTTISFNLNISRIFIVWIVRPLERFCWLANLVYRTCHTYLKERSTSCVGTSWSTWSSWGSGRSSSTSTTSCSASGRNAAASRHWILQVVSPSVRVKCGRVKRVLITSGKAILFWRQVLITASFFDNLFVGSSNVSLMLRRNCKQCLAFVVIK